MRGHIATDHVGLERSQYLVEQLTTNAATGIRAALGWNLDTARPARGHDGPEGAALDRNQHSPEESLEIVRAFLTEPFHARRIVQMAEDEATGTTAGKLQSLRPREIPATWGHSPRRSRTTRTTMET